MRFPDGAIRPAYNAQIAVTPKEGSIGSVEMTDRRNDAGLAAPMVDDMVRRYGKTPERLLVDTHYATSEDIAALAEHAAGPGKVFSPNPSDRHDNKPASLSQPAEHRGRGPEEGKRVSPRVATHTRPA